MQAIVTAPDAPGRLIARDAPDVTPGPRQALVRVRASSINRGETRLIPARLNGWAPGQDVAGVVEAVTGEGGPPVGARVVALVDGGGWSELVAAPFERLALLPDDVSFVQAACLPVAGLTALRALRALGDVAGRELLVTGAAGGVGNVAAQLARESGAFVTALARKPVTLAGVRPATKLDAGAGFERVIDGVGGSVLQDALGHLRPHAKVVFFGGGEPIALGLAAVHGTPATIEALFVYQAPGRFDEDLAALARFISLGRLAPQVDRVVPIADVNDAVAALNAGGINGKIVLSRT